VRYGGGAMALHWLITILTITVVTLGLMIPEAPRGDSSRPLILLVHRSVGLTILAAMVVRGAWRAVRPPPPLPSSVSPIEARLAHATHGALYLVLLAMPILGYLNAAAAGHAVSLFGIVAIPPLIGENERLAQIAIALHLVGQYALYGLLALHVGAALMHGIVWRDGVFSRMLPGRRLAAAHSLADETSVKLLRK
jgi:cytochrome b561